VIEEARATLGEPVLTLDSEGMRRWQQPIVYAWIRGEEVLYIGCSYRGVERPLAAGHEKLRDFQPGDRLVIWASADPLATEDALIRRWRPLYNKPNGGDPCPGCGGRWRLKDRAAGRCGWCQERSANGYPTPLTEV
jgi:hypothetical protein